MRTQIPLPDETSKQILDFWSKHGQPGESMISQPVMLEQGKYTLKIRLLSAEQAERVAETLDSL